MSLTTAQKQTLKAYILADPVLGPKTSGVNTDYAYIANALSSAASPTVLAWKVNVTPDSMDDAPDYSTFDSIAAGKRDSWGFLLRTNRNFTRNKTRKWITDIWGNATAGSNAEAILQAGTESALLAELVIGGGTKTTGTVSALDRTWIGTVSIPEVAEIMQA